jgi:hypothetical protein
MEPSRDKTVVSLCRVFVRRFSSKNGVVYKTDNSLGMERIEPFAEDAMGIGHL